jgi:hypothetical protein
MIKYLLDIKKSLNEPVIFKTSWGFTLYIWLCMFISVFVALCFYRFVLGK